MPSTTIFAEHQILNFAQDCVGLQGRLHTRKTQARKVQQAHSGYSDFSRQLLQSCDAQLADLHQLLAEATCEAQQQQQRQQQQQQMASAPQQHGAHSGKQKSFCLLKLSLNARLVM